MMPSLAVYRMGQADKRTGKRSSARGSDELSFKSPFFDKLITEIS